MRILLLGGTTEASQLAKMLDLAGIDTVFSYAGRTNTPISQPVATRIGGFGGVDGLVRYLVSERISHVVDATHPFAAQMSLNAHHATERTRLPLVRLERPAWQPTHSDIWTDVPDIAAACDALPNEATQVFLAIGRMHIDQFARRPQHRYLLRLVDAPTTPIALPNHNIIVARGPFDTAQDTALLREHRITHVIAKNAGGSGAVAKIEAARALGLNLIMIARPDLPNRPVRARAKDIIEWLHHSAERGV